MLLRLHFSTGPPPLFQCNRAHPTHLCDPSPHSLPYARPLPFPALPAARRSGLKDFLVYVLASFLLSWGPSLRTMEFQDLIMFLQVLRWYWADAAYSSGTTWVLHHGTQRCAFPSLVRCCLMVRGSGSPVRSRWLWGVHSLASTAVGRNK